MPAQWISTQSSVGMPAVVVIPEGIIQVGDLMVVAIAGYNTLENGFAPAVGFETSDGNVGWTQRQARGSDNNTNLEIHIWDKVVDSMAQEGVVLTAPVGAGTESHLHWMVIRGGPITGYITNNFGADGTSNVANSPGYGAVLNVGAVIIDTYLVRGFSSINPGDPGSGFFGLHDSVGTISRFSTCMSRAQGTVSPVSSPNHPAALTESTSWLTLGDCFQVPAFFDYNIDYVGFTTYSTAILNRHVFFAADAGYANDIFMITNQFFDPDITFDNIWDKDNWYQADNDTSGAGIAAVLRSFDFTNSTGAKGYQMVQGGISIETPGLPGGPPLIDHANLILTPAGKLFSNEQYTDWNVQLRLYDFGSTFDIPDVRKGNTTPKWNQCTLLASLPISHTGPGPEADWVIPLPLEYLKLGGYLRFVIGADVYETPPPFPPVGGQFAYGFQFVGTTIHDASARIEVFHWVFL